jgi:glycosyltransferase involved in cell wall biosynthesis
VRVLHVTSSFPRWEGDASGVFIADITSALAAEGLDVHVVAPHDAGAAGEELLAGVHVHRFRYAWPARFEALAHRGGMLSTLRDPARLLLVPPFLVAYLVATLRQTRALRPDVLHAHWWFPGGLVAAIASRVTGIPLVITLHGSDVHIAERPVVRALARLTLGRARVVGVVSEALRRDASDLLGVPARKLVLLRMPVLMPVPATIDAPPDAPPLRLVAVGRLAREKGYGVLLEALQQIDAFELDVFGDGPEAAHLRAQAAPFGDRVRFHGARPRAEIAETLVRAHALVAPSLREGLGLVALEALALGRPVVASSVGGLVETVTHGDDGILVPPGDAGALVAALRRLPMPPPKAGAVERHRPGTVARAHVEAYERARS